MIKNNINSQIDKWFKYFLVTMIIVLTVSVMVQFTLLFGVIQDHEHNVQLQCENTNKVNQIQLVLSNYILSLPPARALTPEEEAQRQKILNEFSRLLTESLKQDNCNK